MTEKIKVTTGILALMLLLGIADASLLEGSPGTMNAKTTEIAFEEDPSVFEKPNTPKPDTNTPEQNGGVRKAEGPDVLKALVSNQFTFQDTKETFILGKVIAGTDDRLQTKVLLIDGDRAGAIAWTSSPDVKKYYLVLKEALHSAFTPAVQDLLDETQRREGHPTRNLLTFIDTGLVPERVVFVRVRERLYEFHVAEGSSEQIFNLIEDLTK